MNAHCNGSREEAACWCLPTEFVRPRFFYGQRLSVVDFSDWLWYHAGKQRFHNLNSHGVGVLCGLRAEPYPRPGEESTTLLTITRGAAYDDCGREVIVPVDQCIDVAAWYLQNEERLTEWVESADGHNLCVGLRYRECPSDPAPAPRDPCGCDAGGCEYARVREGFELRLFTRAEMEALTPPAPSCDAYGALREALSGVEGGEEACAVLGRLLHEVMPAGCPPPSTDGWLWLACFDVLLEDSGEGRHRVASIGEPDNAIAQRPELLSTAVLQEMLLGLATNAAAAGLVGAGPRFAGIDLEDGVLELGIEPYRNPTAPAPTPIAEDTIALDYFRLRRLAARSPSRDVASREASLPAERPTAPEITRRTPASGLTRTPTRGLPDALAARRPAWHEVELRDVRYDEESGRVIIDPNGALTAGNYRLTVISPAEAPIVDTDMRPLLPLTYARNFRLREEGEDGTLVLDPEFG